MMSQAICIPILKIETLIEKISITFPPKVTTNHIEKDNRVLVVIITIDAIIKF